MDETFLNDDRITDSLVAKKKDLSYNKRPECNRESPAFNEKAGDS